MIRDSRGWSRSQFIVRSAVVAVAAFAASACGASAEPGAEPAGHESAAEADTESAMAPGFYTLSGTQQSSRWLNAINLRTDGTFEASVGDNASDLDGHEFAADGTYAISTSGNRTILTLSYAFVGTNHDRYLLRRTSTGLALTFMGDDGSQDVPFAMKKGEKPAILSFGADWSVSAGGTLRGGRTTVVEYAAARDQCPPSTSHVEGSVVLFSRVDGASSLIRAFPNKPAGGSYRLLVTFPEGRDLTVWFENATVKEDGAPTCEKWDTNFGKNFHFAM
jgi:hypothetical protein